MASKMSLKLDGTEYKVLHFSCSLHQNTDPLSGRPTGEVLGGSISLELEATENHVFFKWAASTHEQKSGSIMSYKLDKEDPSKEMTFTNAYLTGFSESWDARSNSSMTVNIVLNAQKIAYGDIAHENPYPA